MRNKNDLKEPLSEPAMDRTVAVAMVNNNPYRISKKKKKSRLQPMYTYEKYGKPVNEPTKLTKAKIRAPLQSKSNVIFFWDHETDSFKFS